MKARYAGGCPECGSRYTPGTEITKIGRGWGHVRCADRKMGWGERPAGNDGPDAGLYAEATRSIGEPDFGDWERREARRERDRMNAEYAAGIEDARRYREERDMMGEAWAAQNEFERDMRGLNGDW